MKNVGFFVCCVLAAAAGCQDDDAKGAATDPKEPGETDKVAQEAEGDDESPPRGPGRPDEALMEAYIEKTGEEPSLETASGRRIREEFREVLRELGHSYESYGARAHRLSIRVRRAHEMEDDELVELCEGLSQYILDGAEAVEAKGPMVLRIESQPMLETGERLSAVTSAYNETLSPPDDPGTCVVL